MKKYLLFSWVILTGLVFSPFISCITDEERQEHAKRQPLAATAATTARETLGYAGRVIGEPFGLGKHPYEKRTIGGLSRREWGEYERKNMRKISSEDHDNLPTLDLSRQSYEKGTQFGYGAGNNSSGWLRDGKISYGTPYEDPVVKDMAKIYTVAEHRGRWQGARNLGIGLAATAGLYYGGKWVINKYMIKPIKHVENILKQIQQLVVKYKTAIGTAKLKATQQEHDMISEFEAKAQLMEAILNGAKENIDQYQELMNQAKNNKETVYNPALYNSMMRNKSIKDN